LLSAALYTRTVNKTRATAIGIKLAPSRPSRRRVARTRNE
jgi:hypothetical protein